MIFCISQRDLQSEDGNQRPVYHVYVYILGPYEWCSVPGVWQSHLRVYFRATWMVWCPCGVTVPFTCIFQGHMNGVVSLWFDSPIYVCILGPHEWCGVSVVWQSHLRVYFRVTWMVWCPCGLTVPFMCIFQGHMNGVVSLWFDSPIYMYILGPYEWCGVLVVWQSHLRVYFRVIWMVWCPCGLTVPFTCIF